MAYFFQLPLVTDLTIDQQMALDEIQPIAISGGAGTGKTVVSLWRHIQNIEVLGKFSVLVTFTKTLGYYLSMNLNIEHKNVYSLKQFPFTNNWKAKEIIIDEAQDLTLETLKKIQMYADYISYGADFNQQLYQKTVTQGEMKALFYINIEYNLQQNFRNSYHILNFTKAVLTNFYIPQHTVEELYDSNEGIKPIMFITDNFDKEIAKIIEIINEFRSETHNIAILLPFGNSGQESVEHYHQALHQNSILCSKYYNEMHTDNIEINNVHVTTFKSAKGLEFNTVIIPFLNKFSNFIRRGFSTKVNEEDYYVAFTRARRNLYLISHNELDFIDNSTVDIEYLDVRR